MQSKQPCILTIEQLQQKCTEWQQRLRLQDWEVQIVIRRERDFAVANRSGEVDWTLSKKMAVIRILDQADYGPGIMVPQDMENDLVHELLHLLFAPFSGKLDEDSLEYTTMEQAINTLSAAMVELERMNEELAKRRPGLLIDNGLKGDYRFNADFVACDNSEISGAPPGAWVPQQQSNEVVKYIDEQYLTHIKPEGTE